MACSLRSLKFTLSLSIVMGLSFFITDGFAQEGNKPVDNKTPIVLAPQENLPESLKAKWLKICSSRPETDNRICQTGIKMRNERGISVISMAINSVNESRYTLVIEVPIGTLLPPGFFLRVDNNTTEVKGNFLVCEPSACIGEIPVSEGFVLEMKKGNDIYLVFRLSSQARPIAARIPLTGITRALEGEAIQPEKLQEETKALEAALKKLAENYKQELENKN